jgi:molybdopterin-guanine dinucleotide biosynthesis protein A
MDSIKAYILSGGRSSRFGSDKALACLDGVPLIQRIAGQLDNCCSSVSLVTRPGENYDHLKLCSIEDDVAFLGPMAGVVQVLRNYETLERRPPWVLIMSCDLLEWHDEWLERMWLTIQEQISQNHEPYAAAFQTSSHKWQPFPGLYHVALRPIAEELLQAGERSMQSLLNHPKVNAALVSSFGLPRIEMANTVEELEAWVKHRSSQP